MILWLVYNNMFEQPSKRPSLTREQIVAEVKQIVKKLSDLADEQPDCGGLQGAIVLEANPKLTERLKELEKEALKLGMTQEDFE